ncbi:Gfo/Idh/MocA family oxidoreductase [Serratia ureilytica]|uniref:Gfo/Idh/MocA family oxidoreductase n=1 Tax=Serratia ureilytica TaxID=300181 RepID=UPI001FB65B4C|nr:Gfo/Idh/MocA family oxidoreductase [Serratia ureilytica]
MLNGERSIPRPLRWAMIGGGRLSQVGYKHRSGALRDNTAYRLVAGAFDIDAARGREFGVNLGVPAERCYDDYQQLLKQEANREDGVEVVTIATPNGTHYEITRAALNAGLHVICEKPLFFTTAEAREIKALAAEKGLIVGVTYGFSGHPLLMQMRAMIANGDIGEKWNEVAIPYWQALVTQAKACGVERFALENFSAILVWNPETLFRLRAAVGPMVGLNLDPSHLIWMGADPIAVARALGPAIHHVHGKDVRLERGVVEVNGLLETKPIDDVAGRAWNYVAVGCGRDLQWWKEFFSVVRMMGYNDWVSLEMEDLTMSVDAGIASSVQALQQTISQ